MGEGGGGGFCVWQFNWRKGGEPHGFTLTLTASQLAQWRLCSFASAHFSCFVPRARTGPLFNCIWRVQSLSRRKSATMQGRGGGAGSVRHGSDYTFILGEKIMDLFEFFFFLLNSSQKLSLFRVSFMLNFNLTLVASLCRDKLSTEPPITLNVFTSESKFPFESTHCRHLLRSDRCFHL